MGEIHVKQSHAKSKKLTGRFFVNHEGDFIGEYFFDEHGGTPEGVMVPPKNVIEVNERPDSHRCKWDSKTQTWSDHGPSEKELKRKADKKAKENARNSAIAKLSALGLTDDEIKAIGL